MFSRSFLEIINHDKCFRLRLWSYNFFSKRGIDFFDVVRNSFSPFYQTVVRNHPHGVTSKKPLSSSLVRVGIISFTSHCGIISVPKEDIRNTQNCTHSDDLGALLDANPQRSHRDQEVICLFRRYGLSYEDL